MEGGRRRGVVLGLRREEEGERRREGRCTANCAKTGTRITYKVVKNVQ